MPFLDDVRNAKMSFFEKLDLLDNDFEPIPLTKTTSKPAWELRFELQPHQKIPTPWAMAVEEYFGNQGFPPFYWGVTNRQNPFFEDQINNLFEPDPRNPHRVIAQFNNRNAAIVSASPGAEDLVHPVFDAVRDNSAPLPPREITERALAFINLCIVKGYIKETIPDLDLKSPDTILHVVNQLMFVDKRVLSSSRLGHVPVHIIIPQQKTIPSWELELRLRGKQKFPTAVYAAIKMYFSKQGCPPLYWIFNTPTPFHEDFLNGRFQPHPTEPELFVSQI